MLAKKLSELDAIRRTNPVPNPPAYIATIVADLIAAIQAPATYWRQSVTYAKLSNPDWNDTKLICTEYARELCEAFHAALNILDEEGNPMDVDCFMWPLLSYRCDSEEITIYIEY